MMKLTNTIRKWIDTLWYSFLVVTCLTCMYLLTVMLFCL